MNPPPHVYARLERVRTLWVELSKTPKTSTRYKVLMDEIRAEAVAYRVSVDARGVDHAKSA
jgi:hypothetical protein